MSPSSLHAWSYAGLVQAIAAVRSWEQQSCQVPRIWLTDCNTYPPSKLFLFPSLLPWCSLSLGETGNRYLFVAELSIVIHSLHLDWLWVSVLTAIYCKKLLWREGKVPPIYGYKDKHKEDSLMLCPFSAITVLGSPLTNMTFPTMDSWPGSQNQVSILFCGMDYKLNQKAIGIKSGFCF